MRPRALERREGEGEAEQREDLGAGGRGWEADEKVPRAAAEAAGRGSLRAWGAEGRGQECGERRGCRERRGQRDTWRN